MRRGALGRRLNHPKLIGVTNDKRKATVMEIYSIRKKLDGKTRVWT